MLILRNGMVITVDGEGRIIENGSVVIDGCRIVDVDKAEVIDQKGYKADKVIDITGQCILPGLVSLHHHSGVSTKGLMEQMGLEEYLDEVLYPSLAILQKEEAYWEAMLAYAEAVKSGITCVNDQYRHIDMCAKAAQDLGLRAVISAEMADKVPGQESIEDNEKGYHNFHGSANDRIRIWFGIEWIPVNSPESIVKVRELATKYKTGVHVHLNESIGEVEVCKKRYGKRPVEHVYDLGLLGPDVVAAHCVWLSDREIAILKETGTHVSHNPVSNMKLGNGPARVIDLINAGINVGLGPDSPSCNNNLDLWETMKMASILHKGVRNDASVMQPETVLRMGTINGAKALGLDSYIGSIEVGKKADVIMVNLNSVRLAPSRANTVVANLVHAARPDDVTTVMIDGQIVVEDRVLKTADEREIVRNAYRVADNLLSRLQKH